MFFLQYLNREISIHPSFFASNVNEILKAQLFADMEGTCTGEYYIVCIMDIYSISPGKVRPGSGEAQFTVHYRAIVWKPFKGETVDCAVSKLNSQGVFCDAGPVIVFVSRMHLPPGFKYNPDATLPQFSNSSGEVIEKGTALRVQIMGMRNEMGKINCVGKMSAQWFGPA